MKRLICSAAVASALLAVTAVPSGAVSVFVTVAPGALDLTLCFHDHGRTSCDEQRLRIQHRSF